MHDETSRERGDDAHAPEADVPQRALRVYLAASTAELHRARAAVEALGAAGIDVRASWLENVERVGVANPTDVPALQRRIWSDTCLDELDDCDLLWFLVPPSFTPTRGAWVEAGYAHALGKRLVFSGTTRQSIFCALGTEFALDSDALAAIRAIEVRP